MDGKNEGLDVDFDFDDQSEPPLLAEDEDDDGPPMLDEAGDDDDVVVVVDDDVDANVEVKAKTEADDFDSVWNLVEESERVKASHTVHREDVVIVRSENYMKPSPVVVSEDEKKSKKPPSLRDPYATEAGVVDSPTGESGLISGVFLSTSSEDEWGIASAVNAAAAPAEEDVWAEVMAARTSTALEGEGEAGDERERKEGERDEDECAAKELLAVLTYADFWTDLQGSSFSFQVWKLAEERSGRVEEEQASCWKRLFGPPKIANINVREESILIFALANTKFTDATLTHPRGLYALFRGLTGDGRNPPRTGRHWESIGFQGNDPATDFRACGIWGLLQLVYFVQAHGAIANDIYLLSQDQVQNFPFAVVGINLSATVLETIRGSSLNKEINSHKDDPTFSLVTFVHEYYCALFYYVYSSWKRNSYTIVNFGPLLQEVSENSRKTPKMFLDLWQSMLAERLERSQGMA